MRNLTIEITSTCQFCGAGSTAIKTRPNGEKFFEGIVCDCKYGEGRYKNQYPFTSVKAGA